jgi:hypothetical protein
MGRTAGRKITTGFSGPITDYTKIGGYDKPPTKSLN